jgi:hypothetical protein
LHYESLHCCGIADRRTLPRWHLQHRWFESTGIGHRI